MAKDGGRRGKEERKEYGLRMNRGQEDEEEWRTGRMEKGG